MKEDAVKSTTHSGNQKPPTYSSGSADIDAMRHERHVIAGT